MPKGQKTKKNELMFSKPKFSYLQSITKDLRLTPEERKDLKEFMKKKEKEEGDKITSISVRMKFVPQEQIKFHSYVSLAIEEGKANKNIQVAMGEVAAFAVKKLLKNDKYFQAKYNAKDIPILRNEPLEKKKK